MLYMYPKSLIYKTWIGLSFINSSLSLCIHEQHITIRFYLYVPVRLAIVAAMGRSCARIVDICDYAWLSCRYRHDGTLRLSAFGGGRHLRATGVGSLFFGRWHTIRYVACRVSDYHE